MVKKMVGNFIRCGSTVALIGFALLVAALTLRTIVTAQNSNKNINLESFSLGITAPQQLRICIGNMEPTSTRSPRESVSLVFAKIQNQSGDVILNRQLSVPQGQFRCTDFSHSELVAAGLVPESNTRVQFAVTVGATEALSVGAAQSETFGSVETISADGRTETYKTIQSRQTTVIQDL